MRKKDSVPNSNFLFDVPIPKPIVFGENNLFIKNIYIIFNYFLKFMFKFTSLMLYHVIKNETSVSGYN